MNRMDRRIAMRIYRGKLPTAYDAWDYADREICDALNVKSYDYTKRGGLVIFDDDEKR